ncbi:MAG TPA: hypothetical protein DCQ06_11140 [Myxococcales bacterium]|nr:hypothetical protein [Myxococcales bacterium]HAN32143.1 hypothetical protein [Myxococcales bacterium]
MKLHDWTQPHVPKVFEAIDRIIGSRTSPPWARDEDDELLQRMCHQHLSTGGKRLRALLPPALMAAEGGDVAAGALLGACVEVLHNGTLVHDDIQDGDELRRGKPTLWREVGVAQAINAGDVMLVAPIAVISSAPEIPPAARAELSALLAGAVTETIRGQVGDLDLKAAQMPTLDHANGIALAKTGPFFAACLQGVVILLGASDERRAAAHAVGKHIGIAFQVRDDLLDVRGVKGRGQAGADIREGKPSWPLLAALQAGPAEQAVALKELLERAHSGEPPSPADVERWLQWVEQHGGVQAAQRALDDNLSAARRQSSVAFGEQGVALIDALCTRLEEVDG